MIQYLCRAQFWSLNVMDTLLPASRLLPVMFTMVPPETGPRLGERLITRGICGSSRLNHRSNTLIKSQITPAGIYNHFCISRTNCPPCNQFFPLPSLSMVTHGRSHNPITILHAVEIKAINVCIKLITGHKMSA